MMRPPREKTYVCVVRVRLECGHVIKLRTSPMSDYAKFGCSAGLGCGYMLNWHEWWFVHDPGSPNTNKMHKKVKSDNPSEEGS